MRKRVLSEVTISCDPPEWFGWRYYPSHEAKERYAQHCEGWVKEFHAFIRDHRSQDPVNLSVERKYEDQCSFCGRVWEEDAEGPVCCSAAQKEWDEQKAKNAA